EMVVSLESNAYAVGVARSAVHLRDGLDVARPYSRREFGQEALEVTNESFEQVNEVLAELLPCSDLVRRRLLEKATKDGPIDFNVFAERITPGAEMVDDVGKRYARVVRIAREDRPWSTQALSPNISLSGNLRPG